MERKTMIAGNGPLMMATALLSILAYHVVFGQQTVKADFAPVQAGQAPTGGTDKGPKWTVTPVMWGDATKQYLCVIKEGDKDVVGINSGRSDLAANPTYMAIYQLKANATGIDVELTGNRQIDYDLKLPTSLGGNGKAPTPYEVEKQFSRLEKDLAEKEKERAEKEKKEKDKKDGK
ncbi:MAG: hypothetical protein IT462_10375 [Planctomycetes bacterium]|nr:hypothetical protein [Planctomycetota bacterium]